MQSIGGISVGHEGRARVLLVGLADGVDRGCYFVLLEQVEQPPHAAARAILELGLHRYVAFALQGNFLQYHHILSMVITVRCGKETYRAHFLEYRLRLRVPVVERVLATLLVVNDEVHRDLRTVRPLWVGRVTSIPSEVTRGEVGEVDSGWRHILQVNSMRFGEMLAAGNPFEGTVLAKRSLDCWCFVKWALGMELYPEKATCTRKSS